MPTENRSSNTEQMVSVPREVAEQIATDTEHDNDLLWIAKEMRKILSQPAAQHQGEPVAYAVFADNGNIRIWSTNCEAVGIKVMQEEGKQAVPLYLHPPTSDGFSAGDMADQGAKAFAARDPEVEALRSALQFYADRDHFSEDIGSDWDNVSGEPANIFWHESEAWFVEDGSIARAALSGSAASPVEYGPTPGCKQCEEAEACGLTDCPECDAQLCEDVNGDGVRPDA